MSICTKPSKLQASSASGEHDLAIIERLIAAGLGIVRCRRGGKAPDGSIYDCTTTHVEDVERWLQDGYNIGKTVRSDRVIIIDADARHGATRDALSRLGLTKTWTCVTGGAPVEGNYSFHFIYRLPDNVTIVNKQLGPGISILGKGVQGVMPPSIHPDTKRPYVWETSPTSCPLAMVPARVIALLTNTSMPVRHAPSKPGSAFVTIDKDYDGIIETRIDMAAVRMIESALDKVPNADLPYEPLVDEKGAFWTYILFALKWACKHATPDAEGMIETLAYNWSRSSSKFDEKIHNKTWRGAKGFAKNKDPITIAYLINWAIEADRQWTGVPMMSDEDWARTVKATFKGRRDLVYKIISILLKRHGRVA